MFHNDSVKDVISNIILILNKINNEIAMHLKLKFILNLIKLSYILKSFIEYFVFQNIQ